MKYIKNIKNILIILCLIIPNISLAHPGNTDSSGCHTCRTNCLNWGLSMGEYHCHRSKGVTQPLEPVRSIRNENGTGETVLAPEYKVPVNDDVTSVTSPYAEKPSLLKRFFKWLF